MDSQVSAAPITTRLINARLKTPHDYLQSGFPNAAIEMMIADPKWICAQDEYSFTPLHKAADFEHTGAVQWLLDHGANVSVIAFHVPSAHRPNLHAPVITKIGIGRYSMLESSGIKRRIPA